ncbi:MAG: hypothetical protein RIS44_3154 [Pseudomonadota bacterium]|jgi:hypothetical protein
MSAVFPLFWNASFAGCGLPVLGAPRRVFAPAGRPTFFAGAKKVGKETPNTSLFERFWLSRLTRLQQVVRLGATSIHGDVKGLFFHQECLPTTVIPAFAGMTKRGTQPPRDAMSRRDAPKTSPECQWPLAEPRPHVCTPAPTHHSPNRLVFRCFLGDFFCTSKRSYSAAGPRPGAVYGVSASNTQAIRLELNDVI